jgi:hypothetical protein
MGRPLYPYELGDPDFSWLLMSFQENNPDWIMVESTSLPVVLINSSIIRSSLPAGLPPRATSEDLTEESLDKPER